MSGSAITSPESELKIADIHQVQPVIKTKIIENFATTTNFQKTCWICYWQTWNYKILASDLWFSNVINLPYFVMIVQCLYSTFSCCTMLFGRKKNDVSSSLVIKWTPHLSLCCASRTLFTVSIYESLKAIVVFVLNFVFIMHSVFGRSFVICWSFTLVQVSSTIREIAKIAFNFIVSLYCCRYKIKLKTGNNTIRAEELARTQPAENR